ncbi:MAG: hypothetical protein NVS9B7_15580 [Flavisolibacter sp.]
MFFAGLLLSTIALPDRFGSISLLIVNAALISLITGLGADSMVLHQLSNQKWTLSQARQFTLRTIFFQLLVFIILELLCFTITHRTLLTYDSLRYMPLDIIYFSGLILTEKYIALLYAMHKAARTNLILLIIALVYLAILTLVYYLRITDFDSVLYLFAIQSLVQGLAMVILFQLSQIRTGPRKLMGPEITNAYKLSFIVMVTNVIQLTAYRMDFWVLKLFHGNYEVGLYAIAGKFANLMWVIPNIFAQLLIPKFIAVKKSEIPVLFSAAFYCNALILLFTVSCTWFFYTFYLDNSYSPGFRCFLLMLPGYFFWAAVIYYGAYFSWLGKFQYNLVVSSICLVLIAVADLILIPKYSIEGAAVANSLVYSLSFLVYVGIMKYKLSLHSRQFFIFHKKDLGFVSKFLRS